MTDNEVVQGPALSANGSTAVATDSQGSIVVAALPSGPVSYLATTHSSSATISPDGKTIADLEKDGDIIFWSVSTHHHVGQLDGDHATFITYSPDGALLAMTTSNGRLRLFSANTRTPIGGEIDVDGPLNGVVFSPNGRWLAADGSALVLWHIDHHTLETCRARPCLGE
jgi:WD40 repeat protein